jgi:polysaccharide transporter, PST family
MAQEKTEQRIVLRNMTAMYVLQLVNYLIPLVTLPYLVRQLGSETYGWLIYATTINFYFVLASDAGINTLAAQKLARLDTEKFINHRKEAATVIVNTTALKGLITIVFATLLWTLVQWIPDWKNQASLFLISFLPVIGSLTFPAWLFQGLQIMHKTMIFAVTGRLIATVGLFFFVHQPQDLLIAASLQNSATLLSGMLCIPTILCLRQVQWCAPNWHTMKQYLKESRSLCISEYTLTALANSNIFWVSLFNDKATVGNFAAIEKALRAAASLFQPLIQALNPRLVKAWSTGSTPPELLSTWLPKITILAIVTGLFGVLLSPTALHLLYGNITAGHETWGQILSIWLIFHTINNLNGHWWWAASGRHTPYTWRILTATTVQWLMFMIMLSTRDMENALWSYTLTEAFMSCLLLWRRKPAT